MRLPVCESQVLILKELLRADTVAYFCTDVNNPLARFDGITRLARGAGVPLPHRSGGHLPVCSMLRP